MRAPLTIAILILLMTAYGFTQPQAPADSPATNRSAVSQPPPVNVTVSTLPPNAEDLARRAQEREEDLSINRGQLIFNSRLVWITGAQLIVGVASVWISWLALSVSLAAKRNMDRQTELMRNQLSTTFRTVFELEKPTATVTDGSVRVSWLLHNYGKAPMEIRQISAEATAGKGPDWDVSEQCGALVLGVDRALPLDAFVYDLTDEDLALINNGRLFVRVQYEIELTDPIDAKVRRYTCRRRVLIRTDDTLPAPLGNWPGWPEAKGELR